MTGTDWPKTAIECLRILWADGMSVAAIGRRLGRSKNSIVGKVHRLDLPGRPSPIKLAGSGLRPHQIRTQKRVASRAIKLPPLLSLLDDPILLTSPPRERPAPKPKPVVKTPRPVHQSNRQCEWRDGDKPFARCSHKSVFGYPYCSEHCQRSYVNWRGAAEGIAA